jgi:hypothetical protein
MRNQKSGETCFVVFWVTKPCSLVFGYQRLGGTYRSDYTVSQARNHNMNLEWKKWEIINGKELRLTENKMYAANASYWKPQRERKLSMRCIYQ